ncbi:MAG: methionyl-tRNA formyltransferase, partial [Oscillibacter sp.]|nr:methionyl-tRNA formyltransferase [Oscillibacter sp.]
MRILFMGTPDFAAVSLKRLFEDGHEICGVFTQPDKPGNRNKITFSAVKEYALSQGLSVYQPQKLRDGTAYELIKTLAPELIVVVAYGRILPKEILDLPPYGCVNVHASLLPKYRGAAPINHAILNGERETGVSVMYMAEELDAGDVIATAKTEIGDGEDLPSLWTRLAELGAETLSKTVPHIADGTAPRTPQDNAQATFAPMMSRELSPIDWNRPSEAIRNQVRGLIPWPCASALLAGTRFKIYRTERGGETDKAAGTILSAGKRGIEVACGDGRSIYLTELQADGGKRMAAGAYLLGHP